MHKKEEDTGQIYCHALIQAIFPTQGSNPGLPSCRQIFYQLGYQGSPTKLEKQANTREMQLTVADWVVETAEPPWKPVQGKT